MVASNATELTLNVRVIGGYYTCSLASIHGQLLAHRFTFICGNLSSFQKLWPIELYGFFGKMRSKVEASIPNKKKLPYPLLIKPYLPPIMEGKDIELIFDDIIFEPTDD